MAAPELLDRASASVWDPPADVPLSAGWRHVGALAATVGIGTLVGALGTLSFPVGDTPTGFAPATAIQSVGGIWFGGWGVVAGMLFPALVRFLTGVDNSPGRVVADLILSGLAAACFRRYRCDPRLQQPRDRLMFLAVGVGAANLAAALVGASYVQLSDERGWQFGRWLSHVATWFVSGAAPCLVLGLPLLRTLSPVVVRSSLFCRTWWQSPVRLGPPMRRFRHQPIIVKIMVGLGAAGFLPLLVVVTVNLWESYRAARDRAVDTQRELAERLQRDLLQMLTSHEELLARHVRQLHAAALPEPLSERVAVGSPLLPTLGADLRYRRIEDLQDSGDIGAADTEILHRGLKLLRIGPGHPPERRRAINLMRLVTEGNAKGTVVVDAIGLEELEKSMFAAARQRGNEYGLFTAERQPILRSDKFRDAQQAGTDREFTRSANGKTLLYHSRVIEPVGWHLELMIPRRYGVKEALAERRNYTAVFTTLALFAALLIGGYLARTLERPIRDLTRTVRQAGQLDVEVEAQVHGHDEIGELAAAFNEMSRQLRRSIAALERATAEKERLAYEVELAADLQRRILPARPPAVPGFDIAGLCVPAREVGGDFYDWHVLSDIRVGFLIGDACGKGLAAAFLVSESRSIAVSHMQDTPSAGAVLRRTNHTMFQSRTMSDAFTTMFCAILSVPSRRLDYASAGHPPAIWYRPSTGEMAALDTDGRPLGLDAENPVGDGAANLLVGDVVVMFTDGVLDATNPAGEPFGRERLEAIVRENYALPAAELAGLIEQRVREYCGDAPQFDDLTLLVIRAVEIAPAHDTRA